MLHALQACSSSCPYSSVPHAHIHGLCPFQLSMVDVRSKLQKEQGSKPKNMPYYNPDSAPTIVPSIACPLPPTLSPTHNCVRNRDTCSALQHLLPCIQSPCASSAFFVSSRSLARSLAISLARSLSLFRCLSISFFLSLALAPSLALASELFARSQALAASTATNRPGTRTELIPDRSSRTVLRSSQTPWLEPRLSPHRQLQ